MTDTKLMREVASMLENPQDEYRHLDAGSAVSHLREAADELDRLRVELVEGQADVDRILRSSVPERWKDCTSAIGAVQSYIAELESAQSPAEGDELREELAAAEKSVSTYMAERNQARDRVRQLRSELDAQVPVMTAAAEAIESLLSLIRRNAPELSGKVIGWAERDLAALQAIVGSKPPVQGSQP